MKSSKESPHQLCSGHYPLATSNNTCQFLPLIRKTSDFFSLFLFFKQRSGASVFFDTALAFLLRNSSCTINVMVTGPSYGFFLLLSVTVLNEDVTSSALNLIKYYPVIFILVAVQYVDFFFFPLVCGKNPINPFFLN